MQLGHVLKDAADYFHKDLDDVFELPDQVHQERPGDRNFPTLASPLGVATNRIRVMT